MGVHGLWELLSPVGHRVSNEHVRNKILAIDISIWLTQFVKAMRDAEGAQVRNAHLLGVFRRCIKLLYLSVRPVLVFDGDTPALKRRTLAGRRAMRERHEAKLRRLAERMLVNRMKQHVVADAIKKRAVLKVSETVVNDNTEEEQEDRVQSVGGNQKPQSPSSKASESDAEYDPAEGEDFIELLHKSKNDGKFVVDTSEKGEHGSELIHNLKNVDDFAKCATPAASGDDKESFRQEEEDAIFAADLADEEEAWSRNRDAEPIELPYDPDDINDETLQDLPATMQSEVFKQIKLHQRAKHRERMMLRRDDPAEFSRTQIEGFLQSTALNRKISNVRNALNSKSGATQRIASDSARQFVLEENEVGGDSDEDGEFEDDYSNDDLQDARANSSQRTRMKSTEVGASDILAQIRAKRDVGLQRSLVQQNRSREIIKATREKQSGVGWASRVLEGRGGLTLGGRSALGGSLDEKNEKISEDEEELQDESFTVLPEQTEHNTGTVSGLNEDDDDDDIEWEDGKDTGAASGVNANEAFIENPFSKKWQNQDKEDTAAGYASQSENSEPDLLDLDDEDQDQEETNLILARERHSLIDNDTEDIKGNRMRSEPIHTNLLQDFKDSGEKDNADGAITNKDLKSVSKPDYKTRISPAETTLVSKNHDDLTTLMTSGLVERGATTDMLSGKPKRQLEVEAESRGPIDERLYECNAASANANVCSATEAAHEQKKYPERFEDKNKKTLHDTTPEGLQDNNRTGHSAKGSDQKAVRFAENEDDVEVCTTNSSEIGRERLKKGRIGKLSDKIDDDIQQTVALSLENESLERTQAGRKKPADEQKNKADEEEDEDIQMAIALSLGKNSAEEASKEEVAEHSQGERRITNGSGGRQMQPLIEMESTAEGVVLNGLEVSIPQDEFSHSEKIPENRFDELDTSADLPTKDRVRTDLSQATKEEATRTENATHSSQNEKGLEDLTGSNRGAVDGAEARHYEATEMSTERMQELRDELEVEERELQRQKTSHQGAAESVSEEMYGETRDLLRLFGIPYLQAPMEAEAQCAFLNKESVVDGIITEDSDAFLFGAQTVYRRLFSEGQFAEAYEATDIVSKLGLNRDLLIQLAYLLGSDYTIGVRGVGVVNSMEILEAFPGEKGLKEFREWTKQVTVFDKEPDKEVMTGRSPEAVRRQFCWKHRNMKRNWEIRSEFPNAAVAEAYRKPEVNHSTKQFKWGRVDFVGLGKFCWEKFGWEKEHFDAVTGPLRKKLAENRGRQQRTIDEFFKPHRFAKIRSERLQTAVKGIVGEEAVELMANITPRVGRKRKAAAVTQVAVNSDEEKEMLAVVEKIEEEEQQKRQRKSK